MPITDIRLYNGEAYLLKTLTISCQEIEQKLSTIVYTGEGKTRDAVIENSKIPFFSTAFFHYVFSKEQIPDEDELYGEYLTINKMKEVNESLIFGKSRLSAVGVKNRMLRSYPSLIRDFHFFVLCQESRKFDSVKYSTKLDILEGIDLLIEQQGMRFCVATYVKTSRGIHFKKRKNRIRHSYGSCEKQIELPIDLSTKNEKILQVSNFKLLGKFYLVSLEKTIMEYVENRRK